jgi:hypothetical protein
MGEVRGMKKREGHRRQRHLLLAALRDGFDQIGTVPFRKDWPKAPGLQIAHRQSQLRAFSRTVDSLDDDQFPREIMGSGQGIHTVISHQSFRPIHFASSIAISLPNTSPNISSFLRAPQISNSASDRATSLHLSLRSLILQLSD